MFSRPTVRVRALLVTILAIVALVLLAATISNIEFSEGYRLATRRPSGGLSLSWLDRVLDLLLSILFLVAPTLMLVGVLYALYASGFRARALIWFLWVALMTVGLYLVLRFYPQLFHRVPRITPPPDLAMATPAPTAAAVAGLEPFDAIAPKWAEPVAVIGIALLVALGVVAGAWALVRRLQRPPGPIAATPWALAGKAQRALDALHAGADVRDTVMRCYFEMGRVLDEHYGLVRQEAMTPREFERLLAGVGTRWVLPRAQVERLTRLFEMVRYGSHPATGTQEQEAIACLTAIAATLGPDRQVAVESGL
ncbi:MAG: DUF4129 domain-containing protein [Anaerolineae bacterium]|nr:DUF4129 domain-containing protein [Anaerolineae bacterium]